MQNKRSQADKEATFLSIAKLKTMPEWLIFEKEARTLQNAIAVGMFNETDYKLDKSSGVIRGIEMILNLENLILPQKQ